MIDTFAELMESVYQTIGQAYPNTDVVVIDYHDQRGIRVEAYVSGMSDEQNKAPIRSLDMPALDGYALPETHEIRTSFAKHHTNGALVMVTYRSNTTAY